MEESINFPGERKWQELREFPGKGEVTVLREEGKGGARTIIVRLPAAKSFPIAMSQPCSIMCSKGNVRRKGKLWDREPTGFCPNMRMSQRFPPRTGSPFS